MNRRIGLVAGIVVLSLAVLIARMVIRYLPAHDESLSVALAVVAGGFAAGGLLYALICRLPPTRRVRVAVVVCLVLFLIGPPLASATMRRITYARFGVTVYGVIPVPGLDITVNSRGLLGFREKTHRLRLEEVQELLTADVEVVVIGTGWDNMVRVEDGVRDLPGLEVAVLPTPEALAYYNAAIARGKRVILLAHSTC